MNSFIASLSVSFILTGIAENLLQNGSINCPFEMLKWNSLSLRIVVAVIVVVVGFLAFEKNRIGKESKITSTTTGVGFEVNTLNALLIGGMAISGGATSKYRSALLGALILACLSLGMSLTNVSSLNQQVVEGVVHLAAIGDHGSSQVYPEYIRAPVEGLMGVNPDSEVIFYDGNEIEKAKEMAEDADAVVFVVGYNFDDEGEYVSENENDRYLGSTGGERKFLELHADEISLIQEAGPVNENSVVVLIGGNTILMSQWEDKVKAVLMAYYPGMEGAVALAEILYGDVNPSGKLPYVVPVSEDDLPSVDWDTESQFYEYYHGYARLEKNKIRPDLPYGYGLSYTTFDIRDVSVMQDQECIKAACTVENTGTVKGAEVVQFYCGFKNSNVDRPVKLLRGFEKTELNPGESMEVTLSCPMEKLCWYNPVLKSMELEHMEYEIYVGNSSCEDDLTMLTIEL